MALLMIMSAAILTLVIALTSFNFRDWQFVTLLVASLFGFISVIRLWPRKSEEDSEVAALRRTLEAAHVSGQEQFEAFEKNRALLLAVLETRTKRLDERERDLVTRFSRFHEFLEYPIEDVHAEQTSGELQKLSEQDRQVRQLLEAEAERVYEKIRRNGYTVEGRVDALAIRDESLELIKRVARIYKPESEFPLLETSFEQLARAASRICLHTLVLLEQLPVNVQHYNINTLYGYIRKAVVGYGVYQKATPWLNYLSRGIYAGRMAATTNPATLGAWWLATELGKRGAQKVVENVVDRQAVAMLHDLVTIIGVEAAGIYGTGFRQRDGAWILGTELVELIHAFPASGESLKSGLQQVTALHLRSEYDRIYLYRCLADHRSAGLQLSDSAMLSRDERESIARKLEEFFAKHIHGASEANVKRWREAFERRFDLRLKLDGSHNQDRSSREQQIEQALRALVTFLRRVMVVDESAVETTTKTFRTLAMLADPLKQAFPGKFSVMPMDESFEPPELDPGSDVTKAFLEDLAACIAVLDRPDEHSEQLVVETWSYFRQTVKEAKASIGQAWLQKLQWHCTEPSLAEDLPSSAARAFFCHRRQGELLLFAFSGLSQRVNENIQPLENHWLFGTKLPSDHTHRIFAVNVAESEFITWEAAVPLKVERISGMVIDDAAISNGRWHHSINHGITNAAVSDLIISGSLRGGRFRSYFRPLLELSSTPA